jgi:DNA-binding NtrC family response regulator
MAERTKLNVLYVEDEPALRERIRIVLEMHFETVATAANGKEGLEAFSRAPVDIVICDIQMPVMDGLEMAVGVREIAPEMPIILCTAFTETAYLLKAIELGISAYIRKPLDCDELIQAILRAGAPILQRTELEDARRHELASLELLLGASAAMQDVIRKVQLVADTGFSLILQGETGVGKSYLASVIHGLSSRKGLPFVTLSVGSLPNTLVESQLFGHVKGAFTGAVATTRGLFEEAHDGTLFIDDIDCLPLTIQPKLLHAVEQKRFQSLGSTRVVQVDTRIIAASNRNLMEEVCNGSFREDLFYRLNDLTIAIPPLRERIEDIPSLARTFLNQASDELQRTPPLLAPGALFHLQHHSWPGNLRELKSVMKRAALFAESTIHADQMSAILNNSPRTGDHATAPQPHTMEEIKRQAVIHALDATHGKKMEAARLLDLDYSSFKRLLDRYGL